MEYVYSSELTDRKSNRSVFDFNATGYYPSRQTETLPRSSGYLPDCTKAYAQSQLHKNEQMAMDTLSGEYLGKTQIYSIFSTDVVDLITHAQVNRIEALTLVNPIPTQLCKIGLPEIRDTRTTTA
jgi:hypothetical protein